MLRVFFPPNLASAAARDAVSVKVELDLDRAPAPEWLPALAALQRFGATPAPVLFLQLNCLQVRELLTALRGQPVVYRLDQPDRPLLWVGPILRGITEHLGEAPAAKPVPVAAPAVRSATPSPSPRRPTVPTTPLTVDGSEHYLALSLPSRESAGYAAALELVKSHGFMLEPSNRRWWLRDRHKVLNFLAAHGRALRDEFHAEFTANYEKNTAHLKAAEVTAEASAAGEDFQVTVGLSAGRATEPQLLAAVAAGRGYVEEGRTVYLIDPQQLERVQAAQRALVGEPGAAVTARRTHRISRARLAEAEDILAEVVPGFQPPEAWRTRSEALRHVDRLPPAPVPAALDARLRPYQRLGVAWLWHLHRHELGGVLADEMGLGKTLQVISLLAARGVPGLPHLIVCPASVVPVWREEIARFFPQLKIEVLKTGNDFAQRKEPVIWLASYTQLRKHRALLEGTEFGYAVLDEGQFIKNPDAKVTQTCFAVRSRHRLVLTGTPLENRQLDLWSIFRFLLPGLLGSRAAFEASLTSDRPGTLERLRAQLAPFILRRTKREVATELPPKVEMELICPLTDVQRAEYAKICAEGLQRLGDDVGAAMREKSFGFLALLTRLRQTCCDPDMLPWLKAPLTDSGKLNLLVEKLAEVIGSGHKVVIFSQFVMLLERVRAALQVNFPDLPVHELTGMTLDRQKPVQAFQTADGAAAMLVSLKAAGTGITLHAADYVFLLDPWWNPAVEAQAVDRVHRIGQKSTVFVYRMVTAGTIEERIEALKASKKDLFDKLIGGLGGDFDLSQHFTSLKELVTLTSAATETEQGG